jgi:hypothetical protein
MLGKGGWLQQTTPYKSVQHDLGLGLAQLL